MVFASSAPPSPGFNFHDPLENLVNLGSSQQRPEQRGSVRQGRWGSPEKKRLRRNPPIAQHQHHHQQDKHRQQRGGCDDGMMDEVLLQWDLQYDSIVQEAVAFEETLVKRYREARRSRDVLVSPAEYYRQPSWLRDRRTGDLMLDSLFNCLATFDDTKFERSPPQMEMHMIWTQACLRQIYGGEYLSKQPELMQRFGVSTFQSLVAIFATRRFGKTFAMAQFIAAFIWTQERSVINVFSLSRRASKSMVDKILMMLGMLVGGVENLETKVKNQEVLTVVNPLGIQSTVYSYPCSKIRLCFFVCLSISLCVCVLFVMIIVISIKINAIFFVFCIKSFYYCVCVVVK